MRESVFLPRMWLVVMATGIGACHTPATGNGDDAGTLGRGEVPGTGPIQDDGGADDQISDEPFDALAPVEAAPADLVAVMTEAGANNDGPADVNLPQPPQSGTMCAEEKVHSGIMLGFAGGPNFGDGNGVGLCGYPNALLPRGRFFGAVDRSLFGNTGACGACVRIENQTGSVKVDIQIIDLVDPQLPGGAPVVSADLAVQRMFIPAGNPQVKFSFVPCQVDGNIQTVFDTTTTTNSSLLVMNHRTALADVQIMAGSGWRSLDRTRFNRWAIPFTINGRTNAVRFVDVYGRMVDAPALPFVDNLQDTGAQLLPCLGLTAKKPPS